MKNFTKLAIGALLLCGAAGMNAQNRTDLIWIVGDGVASGWSLDDATALTPVANAESVYSGTIWLEADKDFKFLTTYNWNDHEYRPVEPNATPNAEGKVELNRIQGDDNDYKIHVTESANWHITVDCVANVATFTKAPYQDTHINWCSLFMVGSATPGEWSVDNGTTMAQVSDETPYIYKASGATLKEGKFKITTSLKGGYDQKYWWFRDATDAGKAVLNQDGDLQWEIAKEGIYDVTLNTISGDITITEDISNCVSIVAEDATPVYYNMQGIRIANPVKGQTLIRVAGKSSSKVIF